MVEIPFWYLGLICAAENAHFELGNLSTRGFGASRLQVVEVLVDELVGTDVLGNLLYRFFVRNKLLRRGKINAILEIKLVEVPNFW